MVLYQHELLRRSWLKSDAASRSSVRSREPGRVTEHISQRCSSARAGAAVLGVLQPGCWLQPSAPVPAGGGGAWSPARPGPARPATGARGAPALAPRPQPERRAPPGVGLSAARLRWERARAERLESCWPRAGLTDWRSSLRRQTGPRGALMVPSAVRIRRHDALGHRGRRQRPPESLVSSRQRSRQVLLHAAEQRRSPPSIPTDR